MSGQIVQWPVIRRPELRLAADVAESVPQAALLIQQAKRLAEVSAQCLWLKVNVGAEEARRLMLAEIDAVLGHDD